MTAAKSPLVPYDPLNTLKPVAPDVWIIDGPVIRFRACGYPVPFSTRMTIIRLPDGALWVHSPTELTDDLKAEIDALGPVRYLVAPNKIHYWWIGAWKKKYPGAMAFGAPGVEERSAEHGVTMDETLTGAPPNDWQGVIDQVLVPGNFMTEAVFFHRPSATLILADLIENFELKRIRNPLLRWIMRLIGPTDPNGTMPFDLRQTYRKHRDTFRTAVATMIGWKPERIILAHGRWYDRNAVAELRRAFRWLGPLP